MNAISRITCLWAIFCFTTACLPVLTSGKARENSTAVRHVRLDTTAYKARLEPDASDMEKPAGLIEEKTVSISILGDLMMHTAQLSNALAAEKDPQSSSSYRFNSLRLIKDIIRSSDIAIANMEFTLAGPPFSGYPCFSAPESFAEYVHECGIGIFLTANNHILDKGSTGAARTLQKYGQMEKEGKIRHTGTFENAEACRDRHPLIIEKNGVRIALLNFTYGTNAGKDRTWPEISYMTPENISNSLKAARARNADAVIALPHWGDEYVLHPSGNQRKYAGQMVECGADAIIGSHPHVVQTIEEFHKGDKKVQVIYSLGNALSNMSAPNTQIGLLATIRIVRKLNGKTLVEPARLTWIWCSRPGGFDDTYTVIPVEEYLDKQYLWANEYDYRKMIDTWKNVQEKTKIK